MATGYVGINGLWDILNHISSQLDQLRVQIESDEDESKGESISLERIGGSRKSLFFGKNIGRENESHY